MLYTDKEGSAYSKPVIDYLEKEKIEIHRTRGHPAFADLFGKTYEDMLFERVETDENSEGNLQRIGYNLEILLTINIQ